nr:Protein W09D10.5 [Haemonchus contortus]
MTRQPYQLLGKRALTSGRRGVLREILLPLLIGLSVGYALGLTLSFEEIDSIDHIAQIDEDAPESTLFFLRCLILVNPDAKKPLNFITAIRDTYGSVCNQTIFYTNSEEIQKKAADQYVIVVDSSLNGFYWSYFQQVVDSSSKVPAQWTYIGDEQGYLSVQNLRKLVRGFNHRRPLIFGRIFMQKPIISYIFPFLQRQRMSLQSGIVMTTSAIKSLSRCNGLLWPRSTESALIACAKELGIRAIDPVDEDSMHLFHDKDIKTLLPEAYQAKHKHGDKTVLGCCSDHAISFGQLSYKDIRLADFASVHWKVFGLGGVEEVNASYAIDPKEFTTKAKVNSLLKKTTVVPAKKSSNDTKTLIKSANKPKNETKKTAA